MKTRFAKLLLLVSGIAAVLVLLQVFWNREPEHQGKRPSAWFKQYYRTSPNEDKHQEAARAFRAIGTNAVPFLLAKFYKTGPDSAFQTNVYKALSKLPRPFRFPPFTPANSIRVEAANAIREITLPDDFLVPLVTNRLHAADERQRLATIYLLCAVGCGADEVIPFLRDMLQSTNGMEQLNGIIRLRQLGLPARPALPDLVEFVKRDASDRRAIEAACRVLAEFGTDANDAVPALKARLARETQAVLRINFAQALCKIDVKQTEALDLILEQASVPDNPLRLYAIRTLGAIGPNARASIPILLEAAKEDNERIWHSAATALVRIGETNQGLSAVAERLKHENKQIRLNAAMFIVYHEPTHSLAISNLVELARDPAWGRIAIQELGKLRPFPESGVAMLRGIAANKDSQFRADAEKALRSLQAEAGQREER